jgi:hypothetical protein
MISSDAAGTDGGAWLTPTKVGSGGRVAHAMSRHGSPQRSNLTSTRSFTGTILS